ncbi:hypothetical protein Scep_027999 [Stephania cephalantha]|uniref:Aminotransferase-like plant mobile domain-containing protein n=1 Tax=Stephania cephalantha TaxID=152367 RepID=A0AAP0HLC6_9MAGN
MLAEESMVPQSWFETHKLSSCGMHRPSVPAVLLSCTLFADKSGSRVSIALLKLLEDLDNVGNYAWGAAALAYLYRHLGSATRVKVSQIAGYLTLLEGWVYDHFKLGLATPNAKYMDYVQPRVCRWIQKHETVANVDKLGAIRRTLDRLHPSEVTWDLYVNFRENGVVQAMAFYSGTIKYMDVVEPYHPERILRQFGHVQSIPDPPYRPLEAHRGPSANKYSVKYGFQQDNWERWRNHLLAPEVRGDKAEFEFLATPDYLPWFLKVSHPVITNPSIEDHDMVATTIADNELLERNRRALDAALRWMDLPPELCTIESARTMASDIVNFLSGRSIGPTTTSTTPATTTGTTATSGPTEAGPRQSQHGSTSTHSTPATAQPATVDARPPKRMLGKEYQRKNLKKPKQ